MRQLLIYLAPHKRRIALATLLMAVSAVCNLLLPTLMSDVLDKGVYGAAQGDTFGVILRTGGLMLGVSLVSLGAVLGGYWVVYRVLADYTWALRSALFRKVHTMTLAEVGRVGASNLVTRSTHDVGTLNWVISMLCGNLIIIPLMFLGGVGLCMRKDFRLSLVILCAVPLLLWGMVWLSKRIAHLWEVSDEACDRQNELVRERLRGIRVIRAFDREGLAHERVSAATKVMSDAMIRANVTMGIIDPLAAFVLNTAALLLVYLGGLRMERGSGLTPGDVFAMVQYVNIILGALVSVSFAITMLPHARVAARRLGQVTDSQGLEDQTPARGLTLTGEITLDHVSFTYPDSPAPALTDLSLSIQPGQWVSIIGGTGSGKSTLAELLLGFRTPTEGQIRYGVTSGRGAQCAPGGIRDQASGIRDCRGAQCAPGGIRDQASGIRGCRGAKCAPEGIRDQASGIRGCRGAQCAPEGIRDQASGIRDCRGAQCAPAADPLPIADVRANVSAAPQKAMLYAGTVGENLRMGKPEATDGELWAALELAQLADFVRAQPEGLDFRLEQAAANLSGGQKQRLAIARALLKEAPIYLFDDSFSALDFLTEARVRRALNEKLAGRTRIVITQRVVSAMHSDRIYVLAEGALAGAGTHRELLDTCPIYREIFLSQTGGGL